MTGLTAQEMARLAAQDPEFVAAGIAGTQAFQDASPAEQAQMYSEVAIRMTVGMVASCEATCEFIGYLGRHLTPEQTWSVAADLSELAQGLDVADRKTFSRRKILESMGLDPHL